MGDDDAVSHFFACNDHDRVLFISEKGVAFGIRAFQVPLASRVAKGVPLPQVRPPTVTGTPMKSTTAAEICC